MEYRSPGTLGAFLAPRSVAERSYNKTQAACQRFSSARCRACSGDANQADRTGRPSGRHLLEKMLRDLANLDCWLRGRPSQTPAVRAADLNPAGAEQSEFAGFTAVPINPFVLRRLPSPPPLPHRSRSRRHAAGSRLPRPERGGRTGYPRCGLSAGNRRMRPSCGTARPRGRSGRRG